MIGYLKGEIIENRDGNIVVGISSGEHSVIGYDVTIPVGAAYFDFNRGRKVELYVYTHVREDALDLYGFSTQEEKEFFLTLLSVTGIGPKGAIGILSKASLEELLHAIVNADKEYLVQIPGIGKKTAERVVLELADPLKKKIENGLFFSASRALRGKGHEGVLSYGKPRINEDQNYREAKEALVGLGYRENEVNVALGKVFEGSPELKRVEDIIRYGLQKLSKA